MTRARFITCLLAPLTARGAAAARKVLYVNSYHSGYAPSDAVEAALTAKLTEAGVEITVRYLDSKRRPDPSLVAAAAGDIARFARTYQPDVLVFSDDDAIKYLAVPHFKKGTTPIVFCGVNWSAKQYALPPDRTTGMVEVVPVPDALKLIRRARPQARTLRVVSEDSTSERSNTTLLDAQYRELGFEPTYALVTNFADWQREFVQAQQQADIVYLPTNGAIAGWKASEAERFVREHLRKPTFTCDDFMVTYAAFGLTKVPGEQGDWAASAVLAILAGKPPSAIPQTTNKQVRCYINRENAAKLNLTLPSDLACEPR